MVINSVSAEWSRVVSRVPQGSVLGPLLLNMYRHDIEAGINSSISVC